MDPSRYVSSLSTEDGFMICTVGEMYRKLMQNLDVFICELKCFPAGLCWSFNNRLSVFCLGFFCRARRPAPFSWRPALLKKPKWRPALLTKKKKNLNKNKKYQSHVAFSSVLPFLLPTHSVDCAVHLLLSYSRALLVSSALFDPFTARIMPFFFSSPR